MNSSCAPALLAFALATVFARAAPSFATTPEAAPAFAQSADPNPPRAAIVQLDRPRHVPTALDSVAHPWPGRALVFSALGTASPVLIAESFRHTTWSSGLATTVLVGEIVGPSAGHL